jgi:hypothetical protein
MITDLQRALLKDAHNESYDAVDAATEDMTDAERYQAVTKAWMTMPDVLCEEIGNTKQVTSAGLRELGWDEESILEIEERRADQ